MLSQGSPRALLLIARAKIFGCHGASQRIAEIAEKRPRALVAVKMRKPVAECGEALEKRELLHSQSVPLRKER
jgi:hypothetical protein